MILAYARRVSKSSEERENGGWDMDVAAKCGICEIPLQEDDNVKIDGLARVVHIRCENEKKRKEAQVKTSQMNMERLNRLAIEESKLEQLAERRTRLAAANRPIPPPQRSSVEWNPVKSQCFECKKTVKVYYEHQGHHYCTKCYMEESGW